MVKKAILILLVVILTLGIFPRVSVEASYPPHENPDTAEESLDALYSLSLLIHYGEIMGLIADEEYQNAEQLIEQLKHIYLPEDLKYILERYRELLTDINSELDELEKALEDAHSFIQQGNVPKAREKLDEATELVEELIGRPIESFIDKPIEETDGSLKDLWDATMELGNKLPNVATAPVESELNKTYQRLKELIEKLQTLVLLYYQNLKGSGIETKITIKAEPTEVWAGDSINVSGRLTFLEEDEWKSLAGKDITVSLNKEEFLTLATDENGEYSGSGKVICYPQDNKAKVQALFKGEPEVYQPSRSEQEIEVLFYPTELTLELSQDEAMIGDLFNAQGNLSYEDNGVEKPLNDKSIAISLNGETFTTTTKENGDYLIEGLEIPCQYIDNLTVQVSYQPVAGEYEYAPASALREIKINFYPTELTLELSNPKPWADETIAVSGKLTSDSEGNALPNREIAIFLDNELKGKVNTNSNGYYHFEDLKMPCRYDKSPITIKASYNWDKDDPKYDEVTTTVEIILQFHSTHLEVIIPEKAYPGLPLNIRGNCTPAEEESDPKREITLLLNNQVCESIHTDDDGSFEVEMLIDEDFPTGEYPLTLTVAAKGRYAEATWEGNLLITQATPQIELPGFVFLFIPGNLHIKGEVASSDPSLPLEGEAMVSLNLKGSSDKTMTENGHFDLSLSLPLDLTIMGSQQFSIQVEPEDSRFGSLETSQEIFVVNLTNISIFLVVFIPLGAIFFQRRRRHPSEEVSIPEFPTPLPKEVEKLPVPEIKMPPTTNDFTRQVLHFYIEAISLVEKASQIQIKPYMTLREFAQEVEPKINGGRETFNQLTSLAERVLYSPFVPTEAEVSKAEGLLSKLKEVLSSPSSF